MRFIRALKTLLTHYFSIVPLYLFILFLKHIVGNASPFIGTILLLPLKISVASIMLNATLNKKKSRDKIIGIGFKKGVYFSNVKYLFIQQYLYFIPLIIAFIFALLTIEVLSDFRDVVNIILFLGFIVLSAAISLMLAMTPYLLADDRFDQTKYNPVIFSAKILKGSYVKLIAIRLFFAPWLLLVLTSSVLAYMNVFSDGGSERLPGGIPVLLISLATTFLIIQPLYHLMHAALYYDIRDNIKKYI